MRILILDQFSEIGGAQRNLLALLEALRARGWEALAGMPGDGEILRRVAELGFGTFHFSCGPFGLGRKPAADWLRLARQLPAQAGEIRTHARGLRPDILYLNGPRVLPAAALAGLGIPAVFHTQNYLPRGAARAISSWALRRLHAEVIACCDFVAEPWRPLPVSIVLNGVAGPKRPTPRPPDPGAMKIGCIGRISPEKGQLEFVSAARMIHRALPQTRFVIHGAPLFSRDAANYAARVKAAAQGLPVEFAGWAADVYQALADLDLLLVPSAATDASPLVVLEGLAAGVPMVAFRSGGIPELIADGETGLLADSVQQMADCGIALLGDPARRRAIGTAARQAWRTHFTLARWQQEMIEAIERAAGRRGGFTSCTTNAPGSSAYSMGL